MISLGLIINGDKKGLAYPPSGRDMSKIIVSSVLKFLFINGYMINLSYSPLNLRHYTIFDRGRKAETVPDSRLIVPGKKIATRSAVFLQLHGFHRIFSGAYP